MLGVFLMPDKGFKTIDEQLAILKSRGLTVYNEEKAKSFLLQNNYYRISGYSLTLRDHDQFFSKVCFQNIVDIYSFDHELRHILLKYIEKIEVKMKSIYAYRFTEIHGPAGYLDNSYFTDLKQYQKTMDKVKDQKVRRLEHEAYLKHFVKDLKQDVPLWAVVDLMTIADISQLYSISEESIRDSVAKDFGFTTKDNTLLLGSMMKSMTIIRNLCAHGSRLFNRLFEQRPWLSKKEKGCLIKYQNGMIDNSHLYGFIFLARRLLESEDFLQMKTEIIRLSEDIPFVDMKHYGFRKDWKEVL
jgi:abortive infection bacteriophage resistance protein